MSILNDEIALERQAQSDLPPVRGGTSSFLRDNGKVRENVSGIRVMKSFVQAEGTERDFGRTSHEQ